MTTTTKHTPGPWAVNFDGDDSYFVTTNVGPSDGRWKLIADVKQTDMGSSACSSEEIEANARLLAAAPDMLSALTYAAELVDLARRYFPKSIRNRDKFQLENTCATIGKAIHKATAS